jgi:Ca-activated chloride channel homolog
MNIPTNIIAKKIIVLAVAATLAACVAHDPQVTQPKPIDTAIIDETHTAVSPEVSLPEVSQDAAALPSAPKQEKEDKRSAQRADKSMLGKAAIAGNLIESRIASPSVAYESYCCAPPPAAPYAPVENTERYQHLDDNPIHLTSEQPVSTFSIDVDTGAYANVRRYLNGGQLPPQDAARVEEMINYFDYQYEAPRDRGTPFNVATEVAPAPWNKHALLMKIGIKGYELPASERPAANLVFLVDFQIAHRSTRQ